MKICAARGCEEIALPGKPRCEKHQAEQDATRATQRAQAQASPEAQAARRLYADPKWKRAARRFLELNPLCVDCGELGAVVDATDVDHITPHKGDLKLFWDRNNWQALCHSCHSRKTAREVFHNHRGVVEN